MVEKELIKAKRLWDSTKRYLILSAQNTLKMCCLSCQTNVLLRSTTTKLKQGILELLLMDL